MQIDRTRFRFHRSTSTSGTQPHLDTTKAVGAGETEASDTPRFSRLLDVLDFNKRKGSVAVKVQFEGDSIRQKLLLPGASAVASSCCMDRGNCTSRDHWLNYTDDRVKLIYLGDKHGASEGTDPEGGSRRGYTMIAGEGNVQHSPPTIRMCEVSEYRACP